MRLVQAGGVVAEHLDDAAVGDAAMRALVDHALDLAPQRRQAGDLLVDIGEMQPRDRIDIAAGAIRLVRQVDQLPDRIDRKAEIARMADEAQPPYRRLVIHGNVWSSAADGVQCFAPDGTLIGKISIPEVVANVCFGGRKRNRLYICGTTSLYAVYLNTQGALRPKA